MKLSYKLVIAAFFFTVIGSFIWSANHYYSKYQHEKKRADEAVQNAESATAITRNVLQSLQIVNTVIEVTRTATNPIPKTWGKSLSARPSRLMWWEMTALTSAIA